MTEQSVTQKANSLIGSPFQYLPGNPPEHKILAKIDGHKIKVEDVEMVWNDQWFIDQIYGDRKYRQSLETEGNALQLKILDLAEKLYKQ